MKQPSWKQRRKGPYTEAGIRQLFCIRCSNRAVHQWNVCADGNNFRPLCLDCDIALNVMVLQWMGDPEWKEKSNAYAQRARATAAALATA